MVVLLIDLMKWQFIQSLLDKLNKIKNCIHKPEDILSLNMAVGIM